MKSNEDKINESLTLVESWVADGKTYKEIAEKLDMSYSTFRRYIGQNANLKSAIAHGKDKKNDNVVAALYKNCIGYKYYEEVANKVKREVLAEDGKTVLVQEEVEISNVKKYKGPSLDAQKYWLGNRDKAKWQEDPHKTANEKKLTKMKVEEAEMKRKIIDNGNGTE